MTEAAMFQPLSPEEIAAAELGPGLDRDQKQQPVPIVPVPDDAPAMHYQHREHGAPTASWPYHDADGRLVGYVLRWDFTNEKGEPDKDILPVCYCDLGGGRRAWRPVGMPTPRPLYRLPDILAWPSARVLVVEGEKAADAAARLFEGLYLTAVTEVTSVMVPDLVATTPPHGAKSPQQADWKPLKGRHVVVWSDNDATGTEYAEAVARLCTASGAASVAIVAVPPDFPAKWDLADPLPEGWTVERLRELLEAARPYEPPGEMATGRPQTSATEHSTRSADRLFLPKRSAAQGSPRRRGFVPQQREMEVSLCKI